ncbi:MAG: hypothetical protein J5545_10925 [Bacteroidaceae bacterium]|nr:hypothetical protein [Bacteroidaceae bacterium]
MATLTNEEINQFKEQLKETKAEVREAYDKLTEAGIVPLPDDFLGEVAGGVLYPTHTPSPTPYQKPTIYQRGPQ